MRHFQINEKQMKTAIKSQIPHWENDFSSDAVSVSFTDWYFSPLSVYEPDASDSSGTPEKKEEPLLPDKSNNTSDNTDNNLNNNTDNNSNNNADNNSNNNTTENTNNNANNENSDETIYPTRPYEEPRTFPNGGQKDNYASILSLKTADYKKSTVKAFNAALEKCTKPFSLDDLAAIWEDINHNDYKVTLTDSEKEFLAHTYTLSTLENIAETKSRNQKTKKQPVTLQQDLGTKENQFQDICNLWFQFCYKISDPGRLTIEERDTAIEQFQNEIERFWKETSLKQIVTMTKKDMLSYLKKTAAKYSSRYLKISIYKDQLLFQPQKGPDPEDEF